MIPLQWSHFSPRIQWLWFSIINSTLTSVLAGQSNPFTPGEGRTAEDCARQSWAIHSSGHWLKGEVGDWRLGKLLSPLVPCWCRSCHPIHTALTWPVVGRPPALSLALQCHDSEVESTVTVVWHLCKLCWLCLNQEPAMSECWVQLGEAFRHALFISAGVICLDCAYAPCLPFVWLLLPVSEHRPDGCVWAVATET